MKEALTEYCQGFFLKVMVIDKAKEISLVHADFGKFNKNFAKMILSGVSSGLGQQAVHYLMKETILDEEFGLFVGPHFDGGLAVTGKHNPDKK